MPALLLCSLSSLLVCKSVFSMFHYTMLFKKISHKCDQMLIDCTFHDGDLKSFCSIVFFDEVFELLFCTHGCGMLFQQHAFDTDRA